MSDQPNDEINRIRDDVLSGISQAMHNFRAQIHLMSAFTELLASESAGPLNETQKEYLQQIETHTQRLNRFRNCEFDYVRLRYGPAEWLKEAEWRVVDAAEWLNESWRALIQDNPEFPLPQVDIIGSSPRVRLIDLPYADLRNFFNYLLGRLGLFQWIDPTGPVQIRVRSHQACVRLECRNVMHENWNGDLIGLIDEGVGGRTALLMLEANQGDLTIEMENDEPVLVIRLAGGRDIFA